MDKKQVKKSEVDHIYWFAPYGLVCPSTRYRGLKPIGYLKEVGINSDFIIPERSFKRIIGFIFLYLKIIFFRKRNAIIVIQKVFSNHFYAKALKILIKQDTKS